MTGAALPTYPNDTDVEDVQVRRAFFMLEDGRLCLPNVMLQREAYVHALLNILPGAERVLEVCSGSGELTAYFARCMPGTTWVPSDVDDFYLRSIAAWRAFCGAPNLAPPLRLDVTRDDPPRVDAVVALNAFASLPAEVHCGVFRVAAAALLVGGLLVLGGPFKRAGQYVLARHAVFDAQMRRRGHGGVPDLEAVWELAREQGFAAREPVALPTGDLMCCLARGG